MNISEAITNQFKDKIFFADVEHYNQETCMMEYLKDVLIKVLFVQMFENGDNTLYGIILQGDRVDKECSMKFDESTNFKFLN
jgi:hypothetical protein